MTSKTKKKTVTETVKDAVKKAPEAIIEREEAFVSCVGDEKTIKTLKKALNSFCDKWGFEKVEFVRQVRAFRIYKGNTHVDWIDLNELNKIYDLKLVKFASGDRKYQKPMKRAYRGL
jgi:hypothetical protein